MLGLVYERLFLRRCLSCDQGGSKHGLGTYTWPNMAMYKGEWQNGCMHGVGIFKSPDGTNYEVRSQPSGMHRISAAS